MAVLINPAGRLVAIDDSVLIQKCLKYRGFKMATDEEAKNFNLEREVNREDSADSIFLVTGSSRPDGYGQSQQALMRELKRKKVKLSRTSQGQEVGFCYTVPDGVVELQTPVKIIYTMFESSTIPDKWVPLLSPLDRVIVPSKFCKEAFATKGISCDVVPLGYDHEVFKYEPRVVDEDSPFTFLHYNAFDLRKGFDLVFKAFTEEFGDDPKVKLILKTTKERLPFPIIKSEYPNIQVIKEHYSHEKLVNLIRSSDCFVFPSRGEGFGLTPVEAMACGVPAIIPNASGMSEYFDKRYFIEVKADKLVPAIYHRFTPAEAGDMIEVDLKDLRKQMRWAVENRKEVQKRGRLGAAYVSKNYTIRDTAAKLKKIFEQY